MGKSWSKWVSKGRQKKYETKDHESVRYDEGPDYNELGIIAFEKGKKKFYEEALK